MRLRHAAPVVAQLFPAVALLMALAVAERSLLWLAIGAPAVIGLLVLPGELPATAVVAGGIVTSVPLWAAVGRALARRFDSWARWRRAYAGVALGWIVAVATLVALT